MLVFREVSEGMEEVVIEQCLFVCRKVNVYRVPPAQITTQRYRCQEWEGRKREAGDEEVW